MVYIYIFNNHIVSHKVKWETSNNLFDDGKIATCEVTIY